MSKVNRIDVFPTYKGVMADIHKDDSTSHIVKADKLAIMLVDGEIKVGAVSPEAIPVFKRDEPPQDKHERKRHEVKKRFESEEAERRSLEHFSKNRQKLRKEFIKLIKDYPDDFEAVAKEYYQHPENLFSDSGKAEQAKMVKGELAVLLADYKLKPDNESREGFQDRYKLISRNRFDNVSWTTSSIISKRLSEAHKLFKGDEEFRRKVHFHMDAKEIFSEEE